jgi:exonuclease SbcD
MLYGRKRYEEFAAFLDWVVSVLESQEIDLLLVAGDIFDTTTPSNRAQQLYYDFLNRVAASSCRHLVIVGGNHDSPTFLNAPRDLLRVLDIHVIGQASTTPADDLIILRDLDNAPEAIVCAVPYLRDRDLRQAEAGETVEDKERKLVEGIRTHYAAMEQAALKARARWGEGLPIIATGHLFTAGGQTLDGDGVRDLYVGSLAHVTPALFPPCFDYLALGHLHVPQKIGGSETRRYSGSPLPMGFGEAGQQKVLCLADFSPDGVQVETLAIPEFQHLARLSGDHQALAEGLQQVIQDHPAAWVEVVYTGRDPIGSLREDLEALCSGCAVEVLRVKDARQWAVSLEQAIPQETLEDLSPRDVFERCLQANDVPEEAQKTLRQTFGQALALLHDHDPQAE